MREVAHFEEIKRLVGPGVGQVKTEKGLCHPSGLVKEKKTLGAESITERGGKTPGRTISGSRTHGKRNRPAEGKTLTHQERGRKKKGISKN